MVCAMGRANPAGEPNGFPKSLYFNALSACSGGFEGDAAIHCRSRGGPEPSCWLERFGGHRVAADAGEGEFLPLMLLRAGLNR